MILDMQRRDGAFQSPTDSHGKKVQTAFAVLFLRREFQRVLPPVTPRVYCAELDGQATDEQVRTAAARDAAQGDAVVPALLQQLRSPEVTRRRAAARALFRISGQDFRYHPGRPPDANAAALRRAQAWWSKRRRK